MWTTLIFGMQYGWLEQPNSPLCLHPLPTSTPSKKTPNLISHPPVSFSLFAYAGYLPPPCPTLALALLPLHTRPFCSISNWEPRASRIPLISLSLTVSPDPLCSVRSGGGGGTATTSKPHPSYLSLSLTISPDPLRSARSGGGGTAAPAVGVVCPMWNIGYRQS
jgi:hypothetical protein